MISRSCGLAAVAALAFVPCAWAHHSHAMYDTQKKVTLEGTVKSFQWMNPHVWVYIVVMDEKGEPAQWSLETGGTGTLTRRGWKADVFKPGDKISATFMPLKDGSNGGLLGTVKLSDGAELNGD